MVSRTALAALLCALLAATSVAARRQLQDDGIEMAAGYDEGYEPEQDEEREEFDPYDDQAGATTCSWGEPSTDYPWAHEPEMDDVTQWCDEALEYKNEADTARGNKGAKVVFYGGTAVSCLRNPGAACKGSDKLFDDEIGSKYSSAVWAAGGETVPSLMWRLQNGLSLADLSTKVAVVLIGMEDVNKLSQDPSYFGTAVNYTAGQMTDLVKSIYKSSDDADVLVLGLLPMTGYESDGTPTYKMTDTYAEGHTYMNNALKALGAADSRVRYVDCNKEFLEDDDVSIRTEYLKETIPTKSGWKAIFKCLEPYMEEYL